MTTRLFRMSVATVAAMSLMAASLSTAAAAPVDSTTTTTTADTTTTATAGANAGAAGEGGATGEAGTNTGADAAPAEDDTLRPNVPDYKDPGLSSAPSSNEPGLSYHLRGLSSQIVDPFGGITTIVMVVTVGMLINAFYTQLEAARVTALREQGKAEEFVPLSSRVFPPELNDIIASASAHR